MAYQAASIANEFIDLSTQANRKITQIEIQKLVYFAHGWNLALRDAPLIGELVEAWKWGPVVRTLYDAFRRFGSDPITEKAYTWRFADRRIIQELATISSNSSAADIYTKALVLKVWKDYGYLRPFDLVDLTHRPDSPWKKAYSEGQTYIPNDEIRTYFKTLMAQGANG
jgi:uncharacterized phage-associated protein